MHQNFSEVLVHSVTKKPRTSRDTLDVFMTSVRFLEHPRTSWQHFFTCAGVKDGQKTTLLILFLERLTLSAVFCQNHRQLMGMLHDALPPKGRYDVGIEKVSYLDCSLASGTELPGHCIYWYFYGQFWLICFNSSILIVRDRSSSVAPCAL